MTAEAVACVRCGVDEVGRGALYGPLVVCAVANPDGWHDPDVKDSKAYSSAAKRDRVAQRIRENVLWALQPIPASFIDKHGISHCLDVGFRQTVTALAGRLYGNPMMVIVDGDHVLDQAMTINGQTVVIKSQVKADRDVFEVSAASVIAKSWRDAEMRDQAQKNPVLQEYDIHQSVGYYCAKHIKAIHEKGMLPDHRRTFVKTALRTYREKLSGQMELFNDDQQQ